MTNKPMVHRCKHAWINVGWGMQCGKCAVAHPNAKTSADLWRALVNSGIKEYDVNEQNATENTNG